MLEFRAGSPDRDGEAPLSCCLGGWSSAGLQPLSQEGPDETHEAGRRCSAERELWLVRVRGLGRSRGQGSQGSTPPSVVVTWGNCFLEPKVPGEDRVSRSGPDGTLQPLLDLSLGSGQASLPLQYFPLPCAVTSVLRSCWSLRSPQPPLLSSGNQIMHDPCGPGAEPQWCQLMVLEAVTN